MHTNKIVGLVAGLGLAAALAGCSQQPAGLDALRSSVQPAAGNGPRRGHPAPDARNLLRYPKDDGSRVPYEPGVVLVKFAPGVSASRVDAALAPSLGIERLQVRSGLGWDRMRILTEESPAQAAARLRKLQEVSAAEPNWKIRLLNTPNDPRYTECWGLHNTGQTGGTADADIDAQEAWDISIGSFDVVVAVLDTGVDYNHPDLAANMWTNDDEIPGNGEDDDNNGYIDDVRGWDFEHEINDPMDDYGHGTHCAGTIGAAGNNGVGVAGVNWRVTIMPLRIIGNQDLEAYCLDAAEGIQYAADNGARVMSCSWWTVEHYSQTLEDAVAYADQHDVFLVAAAGNDSTNDDDPGYDHWPSEWPYPNIIAVAATNHTDNIAYFSNYGPTTVDVGAPGEDILSTVPGNGYESNSGTSMATPHVAGVVALMLSLDPSLTVAELKNILFTTVDPVPDLQGQTVTGGRVNAHRALQALSGVPLPPVALAGGDQTALTGTTVGLDGTKSFDPNQDPLAYAWSFYPPAHSGAALSDPAAPDPAFFADVCGNYQAVLTVSDGTFDSDPDTARVYVRNRNATTVETPHPYDDDMDETWTITHPGAVVMSVHFASFDTEAGWDFVRILDGDGQEWAIYDGNLGDFHSVSVEGDTIQVGFTSDSSVTRDGFVIDAYHWCDASNCAPGTGDCDGDPQNGCETDTSSDLENCGWCGHLCVFPHADASCVDARCQIGACHAGWTDCDGLPGTGCESDLLVDPDNCGTCGHACGPYDHATPGCASGGCVLEACDPGWDDCNAAVADGCEQDVSSDTGNCGACGHVCDLPHAVSHECIDSVCHPMGACTVDAESVESPHPYPDDYDNTWVITRPGAAQIAVHFSSFDTESYYDFVYIYDGAGNQHARYHGALGAFDSVSVPGDTVQVRLVSDYSVTRDGFSIDTVRHCESGCEGGWGNCDSDPENGCESDLTTDVDHCGGCGQACGGPNTQSWCIDGVCTESQDCIDGFGDCDGDPANGCEIDLRTDPGHCGACDTVCAFDHAVATCEQGGCVMGECSFGWGDCDADDANGCESDVLSDLDNCGECGHVCDLPHTDDHVCDTGICRPGLCDEAQQAISSPHDYPNDYDNTWTITHPGAVRLRVHFGDFRVENYYDNVYIYNGDDVEVASYTGHLGAFDSAWVQGDTIKIRLVSDYMVQDYGFDIDTYDHCLSGCATGWADCDGQPATGCESHVADDPHNCGACGHACDYPHAYGVCVDSSCAMGACHTGWDDCNGEDTDGCEVYVLTDTDNCGACGHVCDLAHADASCVQGGCIVSACHQGFADCDGVDASGCEAELASDPANCGACGTVCAFDHAAASCQSGSCVMGACDDGFADCNDGAADGCEIDTLSDANHCGGCGSACSFPHADAVCDAGTCALGGCHQGFGDCDTDPADGCETDLSSTVDHCGTCDHACAFDHAAAGCSDGACVMGACTSPWEDCDADAANGCETDVTTDLQHCGACGAVCAFDHAAAVCREGACAMGACDSGFADCNESAADGCETDLQSDPVHCGACGNVCSFEHATASCREGTCSMGTCDEGFADCNQDPADGCETDLLGDPSNCGGCDNLCAYDHAAGVCNDGVCNMGACDGTFADCDEDDTNGCETELDSDPDHCGTCDNACVFDNAEPACEEGECMLGACHDDFADCDQDAQNGCEVELTSDPAHCGACGNACPQGTVCLDGACACPDEDADGHPDEACGGDDCNDQDASIHPGADEICGDGIDQDCDGVDMPCDCDDADGDGHEDANCGGDDCDDSDDTIHPDAREICGDDIDQDCDGRDLACDCSDTDGDGHHDAACGGTDCDDSDASVRPGAREICGDGIDQNCDGADMPCDCADGDGDGYHAAACGGSDCDDADAAIHPGAEDICGDGVDQDCNGLDAPCDDNGGGGCGCGVPGKPGSTPAGLAWLMLGLPALLAARRKP